MRKKFIKRIGMGERYDSAFIGYKVINYVEGKTLRISISIARLFVKIEIGLVSKDQPNIL